MDPQFSIEFDQPSGVYAPGQCVRGMLTIRNDSALYALSLKICIHGEVQTYWKEPMKEWRLKSGHPVSHSHKSALYFNYSDHISYKTTVNILEGVSQPWSSIDNPSNKIPLGLNIFPFMFQLPQSCPPSFEGTHGNIRYSVHVELNRPWRLDVEAKRVFTVIPIIDLNRTPNYTKPMIGSACRHSGFLGSREVKVKVNLPKIGFTPGDVIPIAVSIHNHSKKPLYYLKAKLMQHVHYQAQQENSHVASDEHCHKHCDHKTAETVMSEVEKSYTVTCCSEGLINVVLILPNPLTPSFRTKTIEVDYCIIVEVEKDRKLRCEFPVTIGTIPAGQVYGQPPTYSIIQPDGNSIVEAPPEYQDRASAPPPEND